MIRPTFGYLIGFGAAAYTMAWLCEKFPISGFMRLMTVSVMGLMIYYGIGVLYYFVVCRILIAKEITWQVLLFNCFLLTVGPDLGLCVAAVSVAAKLRGVVRRALYDP